jgi:hypothetical protein
MKGENPDNAVYTSVHDGYIPHQTHPAPFQKFNANEGFFRCPTGGESGTSFAQAEGMKHPSGKIADARFEVWNGNNLPR